MLATAIMALGAFKEKKMPEVSIQFLRKHNDGLLDCYVVHDYTLDTIPQDGDHVIGKTDNVLVKDNDELGRFRAFKNLHVAESFCARYGGSILWVRGQESKSDFIKMDDIPPADEKDVDAFFGEIAQGVNCDAVELADSEFVNLLETLTHKKLSETHKNILFKVLNSNI